MPIPIPLHGRKPVYIGSGPKCAFNIQGETILPKHAELRPIGNRKEAHVELRSLDPTKLVLINGSETVFKILHNGDKIKIGQHEYTYNGPAELDEFDQDNPFYPADQPSTQNNIPEQTDDNWKF